MTITEKNPYSVPLALSFDSIPANRFFITAAGTVYLKMSDASERTLSGAISFKEGIVKFFPPSSFSGDYTVLPEGFGMEIIS